MLKVCYNDQSKVKSVYRKFLFAVLKETHIHHITNRVDKINAKAEISIELYNTQEKIEDV
jgi:hypothetical protein